MAQWVWGNVTLWQRMLRWVGIDRLNMSGRGGVQLKLQTTVRAPDFIPETCVFYANYMSITNNTWKIHVANMASVHKNWSRESMELLTPCSLQWDWCREERLGKWCSRQSWGQSSGPGHSHLIFNFYRGSIITAPSTTNHTGESPHWDESRVNQQIPSVMGNRALGSHLLDHGLRSASYVWRSPFRSKIPKWQSYRSTL